MREERDFWMVNHEWHLCPRSTGSGYTVHGGVRLLGHVSQACGTGGYTVDRKAGTRQGRQD